jgi:E3 ubiquitin-protein ligase RNF1/2
MLTRGRGRTITPDIALTGSDEEDREEENADEVTKAPSSADDYSPDLRQKRCRKTSASQASPARTIGSNDHSFEENDELVGGKEFLATSPLRGEMLAWGKNGTRSQNRHGSASSNGRIGRSGRIAKLVDHLRNVDEMDKEVLFILYLCSSGHSLFSQLYFRYIGINLEAKPVWETTL